MQSKLLYEHDGQRTFAVIMDKGDEVLSSIKDFAARERVLAAQITAIGALSDVVLRYFDWDTKGYRDIPVREQVEVASLIGDVARAPDGKPAIHIHLVVGKKDGSAMAGHLGEAHVRPTLEVIVAEQPSYLQKVHDPRDRLGVDQRQGADPCLRSATAAGPLPKAIFRAAAFSQDHALVSHEACCLLNAGSEDAKVEITLYFTDREPVGPYKVTLGARRTLHHALQ